MMVSCVRSDEFGGSSCSESQAVSVAMRTNLHLPVLESPASPKPRGTPKVTSVRSEGRCDAEDAFEPSRHPPVPAAEQCDERGNEERADDGCVEQDRKSVV